MADAPTNPPSPDPPSPDPQARASGGRGDGNVFERFFPGPTPADPRLAARLESIARAAERRSAARQSGERRHPRPERTSAAPAPSVTADDLQKVVDAVHEQTEVLRALLDTDVAIRDDSRSTAQNSRTFAIAGTAIAFFTLVAAVVTVVISFRP